MNSFRDELGAARLVSGGLVLWIAWIHLHLWHHGYRGIPTIGLLFLLNAIGGILLAAGIFVVPARLLPLVGVNGAMYGASTLAGLVLSINFGLFGFRDSFSAPLAHESVVVELACVLASLALAGLARTRTRTRHPVTA